MPARDGSGPRGTGSMTGRGMGYCNVTRPAYSMGRGAGFGRGFRPGGFGAVSMEEERAWLQGRLDAIKAKTATTEEK